jgi:hypothetical protein
MAITFQGNNGAVLSSGRALYTYDTVLGLALNPDHKFQGRPNTANALCGSYEECDIGVGTASHITVADRIEIADAMIERWKQYREFLNGTR